MISTIREVFHESCQQNASRGNLADVVVVCGTGYIMTYAHEVLGIIDPRLVISEHYILTSVVTEQPSQIINIRDQDY